MTSVQELRRQLKDQNEETRHFAVQALASLGEEVLADLGEALGDGSWRVRKAALEAVVAIPGEEKMGILLRGIRDEESAGMRNTSMEALIRLGEEAVPFLPDLLQDHDADVRKFGVDILGNIDHLQTLEPLLRALEDREDNVAAAAAEYLGKKEYREAVPALVARTRSGEFWVRFSCLKALGDIGDPAAAAAVVEMAGERGLRKAALESLGRMGAPEAKPFVLEGLFSEDRGLRKIAVLTASRLLGRLENNDAAAASLKEGIMKGADEEFIAALRDLLRHDDVELRSAAMVVFGAAAGKAAVDPLLEVLPDAGEEEQGLIEEVLADLREEELPILFPKIRDEQAAVRRSVARVLGRRRCQGAVPSLVSMLEDENGHVRGEAARALGRIGGQLAVAPLLSLLSDPYPDVRQATVDALVDLGRGSEQLRSLVLEFLGPQLDSNDQDMVASALRVVARLGSSEAIDRLQFMLKDERGQVRRAAVEALGMIDGPKALGILRLALVDEDAAVRREAVQRIGMHRGPAVLDTLTPMLQDEDLWVRVRAVQAIAEQEGPEGHEVLLDTVRKEPAGPVKLAAIRALGQASAIAARDLLLELTATGERESRMAAIEALGHMPGEETVDSLVACLKDDDWGLRSAAVKSLGSFIGEPRVRAALEEVARGDSDPMLRKTASDTIRQAAD